MRAGLSRCRSSRSGSWVPGVACAGKKVTGCSHLPTTNPPEAGEVSCTDGVDNDCDGFADGADSDCGHCGGGAARTFEECDTKDFKGKTCQTFFPEGNGSGFLTCDATCTSIDPSQCDEDGLD